MKISISKALVALAVLFAMPALAATATATLSWTVPTARTDGTALSQSEIGPYTLACGTTSGDHSKYTTQVTDVSPYGQENVNLGFLPGPGTYYCVMRTNDTNGLTSADSNEVKIVELAPPAPPGQIKITVVVYTGQ